MSEHVQFHITSRTGIITLDRPRVLNSLSLDMIRALTDTLLAWRDDPAIEAVVIGSVTEKALCAGGDIRFFHDAAISNPRGGSALIEDFFTEEYTLDHLVHTFPKTFVALMDGVVMGGGMGISQAGPLQRVRVVTDKTKMAMPEVNIGLFPDVGGSHFLSRAPGRTGYYLGLTGVTIGAADALYMGLADVAVPQAEMPALKELIEATPAKDLRSAVEAFAAPFAGEVGSSRVAEHRAAIDRHFSAGSVAAIMASLEKDESEFAQAALTAMRRRSPLMMSVTHRMLGRGAQLPYAECLRMERTLVRHVFEHGEVIEGIRALVIDRDMNPRWNPPTIGEVSEQMVDSFFRPVWPPRVHPLRDLR